MPVSQPDNKARAFVWGLEEVGGLGGWGEVGGVKCFHSLCAPRVTKSTTDGEPDKRSGD